MKQLLHSPKILHEKIRNDTKFPKHYNLELQADIGTSDFLNVFMNI